MDNSNYTQQWVNPVHKIGRITLLAACVTTTFPVLYLYLVHGIFPSVDWLWNDVLLIVASFGFIWLIEPISFYPALGLAGTYLAFLTGNIGTTKLPAAAIAQDLAKVEPGSREAEVVSTLAIIGATTTTTAFIAVGVICGSFLLSVLPGPAVDALKSYTVPAVFGALMVTFAIKYPKVIPVAIGVPLMLKLFAADMIPGYWHIIFAIVSTVAAAFILYRNDIKQPARGDVKQSA